MNRPKRRIVFILSLITLCLLSISNLHSSTLSDSAKASSEIKIIVNKSVTEDTLSMIRIKNIFLGKIIVWNDDSEINIAILKNPDVHDAFVRKFIRRSPVQFKNHWKNMVFTGKGFLPKSFEDEKQLIDYISKKEGAIGYTSFESLPDTVKMIRISDL